jgi:small ligand-binding sensory domain FIST
MLFASQLSRMPDGDLRAAVDTACKAIAETLPAPTVLFPFLRAGDPNDYRKLPELLAAHFPDAVICGCAASGVIGGGHEEEDVPALALTAANLRGPALTHVDPADVLDDEKRIDPERLARVLGPAGGDMLVLVDPFTLPPDALVEALDTVLPNAVKLGGLASAGPAPRSTMLYGRIAHRKGALVLRLGPDTRLRTLVAQGCRPIGHAYVATRTNGQSIYELDGKPAVEVMQELFKTLSPEDKDVFRHSLFIGIEMDKKLVEMRSDRLLVRDLLGVDPNSGAVGVATPVKTYDVVQFVLRDSASAEAELATLLEHKHDSGSRPHGALLVSCVGRGRHLFGRVDHDPELFNARFGDIPLGGFFASGEIAPVGGRTFLHGYTSAFALFEERERAT